MGWVTVVFVLSVVYVVYVLFVLSAPALLRWLQRTCPRRAERGHGHAGAAQGRADGVS